MFTITGHKGFHLQFASGWAISVQWGPGNYCGRKAEDWRAPEKTDTWACNTAEIAVFSPDQKFMDLGGDDVLGHVSAEIVGRIIGALADVSGDMDHDSVKRLVHMALSDDALEQLAMAGRRLK